MGSVYFSNYSWDSSNDGRVFYAIAKQMHNGMMPYKDMFDHKGPLLYLVYYAGTCVSGMKGLWLMQVVANFITFMFVYKTARLFTSRLKASLVVFLMLGSFSVFGVVGNSVKPEMWSFPFISSSIYFFYDYFKHKKWSYVRVFAVGFGFGCCLMMKANLISVWVVFGIYLIIYSIKNRSLPQFFKMLIALLLGLTSIIVPCIVWLIVNNSFDAFVECYLVFNILEYSANENTNTVSTFLQLMASSFVVSVFFMHLWLCCKEKSELCILSFVNFLLSLFFAAFGSDYFMISMAIDSSLCLVYFFAQISNFKQKKITVISVLSAYIVLIIMAPSVFDQVRYDVNQIIYRAPLAEQKTYKNTEYSEITDYVKKHSSESDTIAAQVSSLNLFYYTTNRKPAFRYMFFTPTILSKHKSAIDEISEDIKAKKAKFLILRKNFTEDKYDDSAYYAPRIKEEVLENYEKVKDVAGKNIILWKIKEE